MNIYSSRRVLSAAPFAAACVLLSGCGGGGGTTPISPTPPPSSGSIYVTDASTDLGSEFDQVLVFPQSTNGGPSPSEQITGSATGLDVPLGVAVDHVGNMWVTNSGTSDITEYSAGANGNAAPINSVGGNVTSLLDPVGIAIDGSGDVWVVNSGANSVVEFGPNPSGNQGPIKIISGASTLLNNPQYIAVDGNGYVYVTNVASNNITIYAPGANGNAAPFVFFGGNCGQPDGIALDNSNHIYVACNVDYTVREYNALSGTTRPTQIRGLGIQAANPNLYNPSGIAVNSIGTLFVANTGIVGETFGYITIYGPNYSNNSVPGAAVVGGNSFLIRPGGIALH